MRRLTALVAEAASRYVENGSSRIDGDVVVEKQFNEPSSKTAKMARKEARHGKRGNERRNAKLLHEHVEFGCIHLVNGFGLRRRFENDVEYLYKWSKKRNQ